MKLITENQYRIDWDDFDHVWRAVLFANPMIQSRHRRRSRAIELLSKRALAFKETMWIINAQQVLDTESGMYNIEDIENELNPRVLYNKLCKCNLDTFDRADLIEVLKRVDGHVDRRGVSAFDWYWPWTELAQYLDPGCLLVWPDPDWSLIEGAE